MAKAMVPISEPFKQVFPVMEEPPKPLEIKKRKKEKNMDVEKLKKAEELFGIDADQVKVVKKEKGLIERTESSKIILTEDNRQILND